MGISWLTGDVLIEKLFRAPGDIDLHKLFLNFTGNQETS